MYHLKGSPVDPNRIYASQSSGWFGQLIQRSDDGGKTWSTPGGETLPAPGEFPKGESNRFVYDGEVGTHKWYDGTQHPWEFKRIGHIEPSLTDPDTVYAEAEDAALFKTVDGGKTWKELPGLRAAKGHLWQPGAGGMGLHTIVLDPTNPGRIYIAISAAGAFRTDDGGTTWLPINQGLKSQHELPDPDADVGHCVHRIAMHPSRPGVLFMQKHWDVMRTDNAGALWTEVSGNLPSDFGFPIDVPEPVTMRAVLDALEAAYPMLRGTIRDHGTLKRRAFIRFFACKEDLSLETPDTVLPEAVLLGKEPFVVVGAMAGG